MCELLRLFLCSVLQNRVSNLFSGVCFRSSRPSRTCSFTASRSTNRTRSLTNVRRAQNVSPTRHTYPSMPGSTPGSSRTSARSASASSRSCRTCSSTSARTRGRSPTSACTPAVARPSRSSPTCSLTRAATWPTSPSAATPATSATPTRTACGNTSPNTRTRSTWRRTSVTSAASRTRKKHISRGTWSSTRPMARRWLPGQSKRSPWTLRNETTGDWLTSRRTCPPRLGRSVIKVYPLRSCRSRSSPPTWVAAAAPTTRTGRILAPTAWAPPSPTSPPWRLRGTSPTTRSASARRTRRSGTWTCRWPAATAWSQTVCSACSTSRTTPPSRCPASPPPAPLGGRGSREQRTPTTPRHTSSSHTPASHTGHTITEFTYFWGLFWISLHNIYSYRKTESRPFHSLPAPCANLDAHLVWLNKQNCFICYF